MERIITKDEMSALKERGATQLELHILALYAGQVQQSMQELQEVSSPAARNSLEDAIQRYEALVSKLEAKYPPPGQHETAPQPRTAGDSETETPEYFANRREAWQWLHEQGLQMGESTFYRRIGTPGFPRLTPDKRLSRWECSEFLRLQQVEGNASPGGVYATDELVQRKLLADTEAAEYTAGLARQKLERLIKETDKTWMARREAYAMLAAIIGTLRDTVLHHLHHNQLAFCAAVCGEDARAPELYEALAAAVNTAFNEVASRPLQVELQGEEAETTTENTNERAHHGQTTTGDRNAPESHNTLGDIPRV